MTCQLRHTVCFNKGLLLATPSLSFSYKHLPKTTASSAPICLACDVVFTSQVAASYFKYVLCVPKHHINY